MSNNKDKEYEDLPVILMKTKTTLIDRQIVLYVDEETLELVKKHRKTDQVEKLENSEQVYLDNTSICFIVDKEVK